MYMAAIPGELTFWSTGSEATEAMFNMVTGTCKHQWKQTPTVLSLRRILQRILCYQGREAKSLQGVRGKKRKGLLEFPDSVRYKRY